MSIVSKLPPKDKRALALFYETETHASLVKLLKLVQKNAGERALKAIDLNQLKYIQGEKNAIDRLEEALKEVHKLEQKS